MKKLKIFPVLLTVVLLAMLSSCEVGGLELQKPYKYDPSVRADNKLGIKGWEFIIARKTLFSDFIAAVRYAEVDSLIFDQSGVTLFPPTNAAISGVISTSTAVNQSPGGYWYRNPINVDVNGVITPIRPDKWNDYPKEQVKQFVLNTVMKYAVSYYEFLAQTDGTLTFYPTMATNGYGYISLHMLKMEELDNNQGSDAPILFVNDFPSHYKKINPATAGHQMYLFPRTSNLLTSNGSYIHVMDNYLDFPNEDDLRAIPVYEGKPLR